MSIIISIKVSTASTDLKFLYLLNKERTGKYHAVTKYCTLLHQKQLCLEMLNLN